MVEKIKSESIYTISYKYTELTAEEVKELICNLNLNDVFSMFLYVGNEISLYVDKYNLFKLIDNIKCDNIKITKSNINIIDMTYLVIKDLGIISFNSIEVERMI